MTGKRNQESDIKSNDRLTRLGRNRKGRGRKELNGGKKNKMEAPMWALYKFQAYQKGGRYQSTVAGDLPFFTMYSGLGAYTTARYLHNTAR